MHIKTGTFGQPELFDPELARHFLQYARHAHARISRSWPGTNEHAWTDMDKNGGNCISKIICTLY
jgi:hypothetical protein